ncbi:ferritin light chain-like protein [Camelus ferus]|nr:ferritin light chain-like protein [Camelus ferus]
MWLWRGHFSHKLAEEKHEGTKRLSKMESQGGSRATFQKVQKPPQGVSGKTQDAREAAGLLEKHLNQAFWNCMPWFASPRTPSSVTPRIAASLDEQVKLREKTATT